jgi:hypothetical protein
VAGRFGIGRGIGRLDTDSPRSVLPEDRQQAAIIAPDINDRQVVQGSDLPLTSLNKLTHSVQHVGSMTCPVVVGIREQGPLRNLMRLMGGLADRAKRNFDRVRLRNSRIPNGHKIVAQGMDPQIEDASKFRDAAYLAALNSAFHPFRFRSQISVPLLYVK